LPEVTYGLSLATDISLVAWIFNNYGKVSIVKLTISLIVAFFVTSIVFLSNKKANEKINQMEEL